MAATINASSSSGIVTTADNSAQLELQTASTTRLTIDSSGNVGIGTSSPASKLDVRAANITDTTDTGQITILTTTAQAANVGGKLALGGLYDGSNYLTFGSIAGRKENSTSGNWSGYLQFSTRVFGGNLEERMRIDSSGNVGIGTTNPAGYKVRIVGTSGTSQFRAGTDVNGYLEINAFDSSPVYCVIAGANATSGVFGTQSNIPTIFFTNNTERMRITSTGAIQDGSGNPLLISGKETIWVPAFAMTPRVTNGPASILTQLGTNGTLITSLAFDTATTEYAQFQIRMPKSWNESTVTFTPVWTANSTSTASVAWVLRAKALGNAETIDAAWGTGVTVVDPNTATAYQAHIPAESSAVTIANASELEWVVFEIYRDVANVSDTLAADALLLGVTINYTTNAANDA